MFGSSFIARVLLTMRWCLVSGAWCVVWCGVVWCVVRSAWCVVHGAWCVVRGVCDDAETPPHCGDKSIAAITSKAGTIPEFRITCAFLR